ncbi:BIG2, partial [Symbiodinium pilosum]
RRRSVWELMGKIEESPKKARAIFDKSGLADSIPVPPSGGLAAGEPGTEEWVLKLVWLLRTVNFTVPYAAVGEFFGQPKEDSEKAVTAFAETFDWGAADIEKALRSFLEAFLLPKEAQQIDRVLRIFAHTYYRKHVEHCRSSGKEGAGYLKHPDAAYTFAFSVILLNSDQHNPKLKKRMSLK